MPCYDSRVTEDTDRKSKQNKWLSSALCAILNELERRDICESVLAEASRSGLIGLVDFWAHHKQDDVSRLAKELHKYSKDEQAVLKKLLSTP